MEFVFGKGTGIVGRGYVGLGSGLDVGLELDDPSLR